MSSVTYVHANLYLQKLTALRATPQPDVTAMLGSFQNHRYHIACCSFNEHQTNLFLDNVQQVFKNSNQEHNSFLSHEKR